ncbi:MAG: tetratricopeptide repeat protein [Betaproteobacteria bacterium]
MSCEKALAVTPDSAEALCGDGVLLLERGQFDAALARFERVLTLRPDWAEAFTLHGSALHALGRPSDALASYDRSLELRPGCFDTFYNRGNVLLELARPEQAVISYESALALKPDSVDALSNYGSALQESGRLEQAVTCFDRVLSVRPDFFQALYNRGNALLELSRPQEALASYERVLEQSPNFAPALIGRGNALSRLRRLEEALTSYQLALALSPTSIVTLSNRGYVLIELGRWQTALASFERAIELQPNYVPALIGYGDALQGLGRMQEALAGYERALVLEPTSVAGLNNAGSTLFRLRRPEAALATFARALELEPNHPSVRFNESFPRLQTGDFERGLPLLEWRWAVGHKQHADALQAPAWLGKQSLTGKTILLHAEQGFGDTIQFVRYAKHVAAAGATVLLQVPPTLKPLFIDHPDVSHLFAQGETLPRFDYQCPVMSLPLAFGTRLQTIPGEAPYLRADAIRLQRWRERLGDKHGPRVGLRWSGNRSPSDNHNRSIDLAEFIKLLPPCAQYFSLQDHVRTGDQAILAERTDITHFGEELQDFADTAALVELMDVVISVDTSVAHLAGAMGKPLCLLLLFSACWRWLLDRDDSPWYPSAKLFRQPAPGDWDSVFVRVRGELSALR